MSHVPCCLRNLLLDQTNMASVQVVDYIVLNRGKIDFLHALLYHNRPCMTILKNIPRFTTTDIFASETMAVTNKGTPIPYFLVNQLMAWLVGLPHPF